MDDPELERLRQKRMSEMQQQSGGYGGGQGGAIKAEQQEEARRQQQDMKLDILAQVLTQEARARRTFFCILICNRKKLAVNISKKSKHFGVDKAGKKPNGREPLGSIGSQWPTSWKGIDQQKIRFRFSEIQSQISIFLTVWRGSTDQFAGKAQRANFKENRRQSKSFMTQHFFRDL
jgi:DNA-binding TFAR19-related protein (PDSD5 family)